MNENANPYDIEVEGETQAYSQHFSESLMWSLREHLKNLEDKLADILSEIDCSRKEVVTLKREFIDMDNEQGW